MSDLEKIITDFRRFINRPYAGLDDWRTEQDRLIGRCLHGKPVNSCFKCSESE